MTHCLCVLDEPNNKEGTEFCVELSAELMQARWNDIDCDRLFGYICKKQSTQATPHPSAEPTKPPGATLYQLLVLLHRDNSPQLMLWMSWNFHLSHNSQGKNLSVEEHKILKSLMRYAAEMDHDDGMSSSYKNSYHTAALHGCVDGGPLLRGLHFTLLISYLLTYYIWHSAS